MKNIKLLFCHLSIALSSFYTSATEIPFSNKCGFSSRDVSFKRHVVSLEGDIFTDIHANSDALYVVFFSTTWCCHCPDVAKNIAKLANEMLPYKNIKFLYVLVGDESDKEVKKHFNISLSKNVTICKSFSTFDLKGVDIVPSCVVFNKQGKQVFRYDGKVDYNCKQFKDFLLHLSSAPNTENIRKDSCYDIEKNPEKSGARRVCCCSKSNDSTHVKRNSSRG